MSRSVEECRGLLRCVEDYQGLSRSAKELQKVSARIVNMPKYMHLTLSCHVKFDHSNIKFT